MFYVKETEKMTAAAVKEEYGDEHLKGLTLEELKTLKAEIESTLEELREEEAEADSSASCSAHEVIGIMRELRVWTARREKVDGEIAARASG